MTLRSCLGLLALGALLALPVACGSDDGGGEDNGPLNKYSNFEIADPAGLCTFSADKITGCAYNFDAGALFPGETQHTLFRIVNTGERNLKVASITLNYAAQEGEDPPAFVLAVVDPEMKAALEAGDVIEVAPVSSGGDVPEELNVRVSFTRYDDEVVRTATVVFETDATNAAGGKVTLNLGTLSGSPKIGVSPDMVNFQKVGINEFKDERVNIFNTGSQDLVVDKFSLSGSPAYTAVIQGQDFPVSDATVQGVELENPIVVGPGQGSYLNIRFTPVDENPAKATLVLYSNDPAKAEGVTVQISGNEGLPCIQVIPEDVNFGGKKYGQLATFPLSVKACDSETELKIFGARIKEGSSPDFGVDFSTLDHVPTAEDPVIVPAGQEVTLTVTFLPDVVNPLNPDNTIIMDEGILIIDNDSFDSAKEVPLKGAGVEVECPTAVIKCTEGDEVIPQTMLHLIGSHSFAASGNISKWEWAVQQPDLSASSFVPSNNFPDPTFEANVAGIYIFTLNVWDMAGNISCVPAEYEVVVIPNEAIHIELLWKTPNDPNEFDTGPEAGSDVDLHFTHPWASQLDIDKDGAPDPWFDTLHDCFWFNKNPNWGSFDESLDDDPSLDRDDTDGAGPENVNLNLPEKVTYRVGAHYWNDHGFGPAYVTTRVYIYGAMVFEVPDVMLVDSDMWDVCTVKWPSGEVTLVQGTNGSTYKITAQYQNPGFFNPD